MTDLCERLREAEWSGKAEGKPVESDTTCWMRNPDGPEAADRIEALEKALAETRLLIGELIDHPGSPRFYGINGVLLGKLRTIDAGARALLPLDKERVG